MINVEVMIILLRFRCSHELCQFCDDQVVIALGGHYQKLTASMDAIPEKSRYQPEWMALQKKTKNDH
jgi:hypothetical protein